MRLNDGVIGGCASERAFGAEARDCHVNEPGVQGTEVLIAQAECVHGPGPEIMNDHIDLGRELANDLLPRFTL